MFDSHAGQTAKSESLSLVRGNRLRFPRPRWAAPGERNDKRQHQRIQPAPKLPLLQKTTRAREKLRRSNPTTSTASPGNSTALPRVHGLTAICVNSLRRIIITKCKGHNEEIDISWKVAPLPISRPEICVKLARSVELGDTAGTAVREMHGGISSDDRFLEEFWQLRGFSGKVLK